MNFAQKILQVYSTPHSQNVWAYIDTLGWKKVQLLSTDGSTNMFVMLSAAKASGIAVSGTLTASGEISVLYL
ncbi:peptidase M6 [Chitinophaga agrisoli]|uniref:Peptidase M6 n=1 Tax=Chitinophaga agrisoli TaxID=2607653 RepID=A0A5B2VJS8_9BACT|nr:peptidase M6 [Chitinophaga agrisoli]KAA2238489.1 peptidase M6 [Chitinophaga agrisoli]